MMQEWLGSKENKVLGLYLMCDMVEHLKEHSQPMWSWGMKAVIGSLHDKEASVRQAAAYCVNMAAPLPAFGEVAPVAFEGLSQLVAKPKGVKKKDLEALNAADNA